MVSLVSLACRGPALASFQRMSLQPRVRSGIRHTPQDRAGHLAASNPGLISQWRGSCSVLLRHAGRPLQVRPLPMAHRMALSPFYFIRTEGPYRSFPCLQHFAWHLESCPACCCSHCCPPCPIPLHQMSPKPCVPLQAPVTRTRVVSASSAVPADSSLPQKAHTFYRNMLYLVAGAFLLQWPLPRSQAPSAQTGSAKIRSLWLRNERWGNMLPLHLIEESLIRLPLLRFVTLPTQLPVSQPVLRLRASA